MSDLAEKLASVKSVRNTRAQARLDQLVARRGCAPVDSRRPPTALEVRPVLCARVEVWVRVGGAAGLKTVYELDREERLP